MAQLDKASAYGAEDSGFESQWALTLFQFFGVFFFAIFFACSCCIFLLSVRYEVQRFAWSFFTTLSSLSIQERDIKLLMVHLARPAAVNWCTRARLVPNDLWLTLYIPYRV